MVVSMLEAYHIKGREYNDNASKNLLKDADAREQITRYCKKNNIPEKEILDLISSNEYQFSAAHLHGSTTTGDIIDSHQHHYLQNFDIDKVMLLLESKQIVEDYNKWVKFQIVKLMKSFSDSVRSGNGGVIDDINERYGGIGRAMHLDIKNLFSMGIPVNNIIKYITDIYFDISDDPKIIQTMLRIRLNYNKKITQLLQRMIQLNYRVIGLSESQANEYSEILSKNNNDSNKKAGEILDRIVDNIDKYTKYTGDESMIIDLSPLGFGKLYLQKSMFNDLSDKDNIRREIQSALRYDAVVLVHGGTEPDNNGNDRWVFGVPMKVIGGQFRYLVDDFIRDLIKSGNKKILIGSCNPGHHKLAKDIMDTKGVIINYSNMSNFLENNLLFIDKSPDIIYEYDLSDETEAMLYEMEQSLMELAYNNNIDYRDNITLSESYNFVICNEENMLIESSADIWIIIKDAVKRAISAVIWLFKKLISALVGIIKKIKDIFSKKKSQDTKVPITVPLIVTEDANINNSTIQNTGQLYSLAQKSFNSLTAEIKKRQAIQTKILQQIQMYTDKKAMSGANESTNCLDEGTTKMMLNNIHDKVVYGNAKGLVDCFKQGANPKFLKWVENANTLERIDYLRKDYHTTVNSIKLVTERVTKCEKLGECAETKNYYKGIKSLYLDKGVTSKDCKKFLSWLQNTLKPALEKRKKELQKAHVTESFIDDLY